MKNIVYFAVIALLVIGCNTTSKTVSKNNNAVSEEAVKIANDSLEYEITIIDIGFKNYLNTIAKPMNFYSKTYYESKNKFYVSEWNRRVRNPSKYDPSIYENIIDYDFNVDYGLEVNYKLYNYFKFVEYKYKQRF
ncbi:DUF6146 family protein [Lutibacter sp.]